MGSDKATHARRGFEADGGFTLVEILFAVLVLFVVSMGVMGALTYTAHASRDTATRTTALNLANQRLEQIRNLPYDNVGLTYAGGGYGDPAGSVVTPEVVDGRFTVTTEIGWARDPDTNRALYKQVLISVAWDEGSGGQVSVSSNVYGKSELVNTGDLSVFVRDLATDDPLANAWVTITPASGLARQVQTGANGEAFFGYVASGEYAVTIVRSGYIFDQAFLSSVNVVPDLLTTVIGYGQQPCSIAATVRDTAGDPIANATVTLTRASGATFDGTTDGQGRATFGDLIADTYEISASAPGYAADEDVVYVTESGRSYEVELTLPARMGLTVKTMSSNGEVIEGAQIRVTGPAPGTGQVPGSPLNTNDSGEASFDSLENGDYTITASKDGFSTKMVVHSYDGSSTDPVVLTLSPVVHGHLEIHTIDFRGRPKRNEYCSVYGPDGYFVQIRTDSDGFYRLNGLLPGDYTVRPHDGWSSKTVSVESGQTSVVEVVAW